MIKLKEIREGIILLDSDKEMRVVTVESLLAKEAEKEKLKLEVKKLRRKVKNLSTELEEYEEIKLEEEKSKILSLIELLNRQNKRIDEIWDAVKANYWVTKEGFTKDMAKDFINNYCQ